MFHRVRHQDPETYKGVIQKQNHFLSSSRVVPITGLTEAQMFYIGTKMEQVPGVNAVLHHKSTTTSGRWNILTTKSQFKTLTATLRQMIPIWVQQFSDLAAVEPTFPEAGLAFRTVPTDDESGESFKTYLSACSSIYTVEDDYYNNPPTSSLPPSQAWGNISLPTYVEPPTLPPIESLTTPTTLQSLLQQNQQLQRKVSAPTASVQKLLQEHTNIHNSNSSQSLLTSNFQEIVSAVVATIEPQLSAQSMPSIPQSQLDTSTYITKSSSQKRKSMSLANTSMDSVLQEDHDV